VKLQKMCLEGELLPPFYGVAWHDYMRRRAVCYPVPLNMIAAALRSAWIFIRYGYRAIPMSPRDAYAQGIRDAQQRASGGSASSVGHETA
jgi:hypothetical protein